MRRERAAVMTRREGAVMTFSTELADGPQLSRVCHVFNSPLGSPLLSATDSHICRAIATTSNFSGFMRALARAASQLRTARSYKDLCIWSHSSQCKECDHLFSSI